MTPYNYSCFTLPPYLLFGFYELNLSTSKVALFTKLFLVCKNQFINLSTFNLSLKILRFSIGLELSVFVWINDFQRTNHKNSNSRFPQAFSFYIQVGEGVDLIIHHPDQVLESMNEWCVKQHGDSGLTAAVKNSQVFSIRQFLLKISFGFLSLVSYNNIGIVIWKLPRGSEFQSLADSSFILFPQVFEEKSI